MIPSPSSPAPSSSFVAGAGQPPTAPDLLGSTSGDSVAAKPSFNDDDDFYFLYKGGWDSPGAIKQEDIDLLIKNNPGIFDGVDKETLNEFMDEGEGIQDLFNSDPVKYQPIARYISQGHEGCLMAHIMKYGEYKGGFYKVERDYEGTEWVKVRSDHYKLMLENKRFVSQLREFLFDQSMSNDDKVVNLQMLFPPIDQSDEDSSIEELSKNTDLLSIDQSDEDVSIEELRRNMDLLFGNTFKQAQQRAINSGFKP